MIGSFQCPTHDKPGSFVQHYRARTEAELLDVAEGIFGPDPQAGIDMAQKVCSYPDPPLKNGPIDFYFDAPFGSLATSYPPFSKSPNGVSGISAQELWPERHGSWLNANRPTRQSSQDPILRWVRGRIQVHGRFAGAPS